MNKKQRLFIPLILVVLLACARSYLTPEITIESTPMTSQGSIEERPIETPEINALPSATFTSNSTTSFSFTMTPIPSRTPIEMATTTPIPSSTPIEMPTTQPTLVFSQPPLEPIKAEVCPKNRKTSLDKLGLDLQTRLVVLPLTASNENHPGYYLISPADPIPELVPYLKNHPDEKDPWYGLSPDGRWVIFDRLGEDGSSETAWVSSLDGKKQWKLSLEGEFQAGHWLDDETVLLFQGNFPEAVPRKTVNPFTMQEQILDNLPKLQVEGLGWQFFRSAGETYLLYQSGNDIRLFNTFTEDDKPVFQWLKAADIYSLDQSFQYFNDRFTIFSERRPYGLDMSPRMSLDEIGSKTDYTTIMRQVFIPEDIRPIIVTDILPDASEYVLLHRGGPENLTEPSWFYILDTNHLVVKDYCWDASDSNHMLSPDGRFIAFNQYTRQNNVPVLTSFIILNLETGYASQINDYQFIGWGISGK